MTTVAVSPKTLGTGRVILFFVFLTFAAIIIQTLVSNIADRKLTLTSEHQSALVAVRLLAEHANQTLRDAENNLKPVAEALGSLQKDQVIDEPLLKNLIQQGKRDNRFLNALQYVSPKGVTLVSSIDYPGYQLDSQDRTYIAYLQKHSDYDKAIVGRAFIRTYDRELVIPLARTIHDKQGNFKGIISIDISVSYFSKVYARVATSGKALVALFSNDGYVIVRSPYEERFLSLDITKSAVLNDLKTKSIDGTFEDDTFLGDKKPISRQYTYQKIPSFGVTALYARNIDVILKDYNIRTTNRIFYAGVFIVIHLLLTYFLTVHIKRLHKSEQSLNQNIQRLNESETSLRASESKFIGMFQNSPVPLSVIRLSDECIFEVNDSLLTQFGFDRDAFVGKTPSNLQLWVNEEQHDNAFSLLKEQQFVDRYEIQIRHCKGYTLSCLLSARVFDADGEKMAIFSPIDITHQREIEHEIRELNTQLEERVQQRTAKLEESNLELAQALTSLKNTQSELLRSEKMAALGSLVAGVAHELNTPIGNSVTVASTVDEWIHKMSAELASPKPRRAELASGVTACVSGTEILVRNLDRAAELVMSFKQVAVDQSSNQRRTFDLRHSIEEVLLTLKPIYMKTPFQLEQMLEDDISMDGFPGALAQLITNFVTNALAHAFEGRTTGNMTIQTRKINTNVEIIFRDDGVGIPEQNQARVFEPFFTTKLGQGSSGLGMHIVYNLVNGLLGGQITLTSTLGSGTRICVTLPRQAPVLEDEAATTS